MDITEEFTPEEIERARKKNKRYRKSGQHAQATQRKQSVARGTMKAGLKAGDL